MIKCWFGMLLVVAFSFNTHAAELRIAVASDLRFVMPKIEQAFQQAFADTQTQVIYGSSGRFFSQISNGAPFHIYMSADIEYPKRLQQEQPGTGDVVAYGDGQLALWQRGRTSPDMDALRAARRIAIANPQHAPYGQKALLWLQQLPEWPELEGKLVYAESAAQVAHFVRSGSAEVGITALALVLSEELRRQGSYLTIPPTDGYPAIQQGMVITARGAAHSASQDFVDFMQSEQARQLLLDAGFIFPDAAR
ncbi:MAG: molybdate ABC transporter substrate-binding protein [Idiomarina sp.]|nr:molybdate ABC transporter substrate-binding protein [Idiomarina sp.]